MDQRLRDQEQRLRDQEQRIRDQEQRRRDHEQAREERIREREERQAEREQRRADEASPLFTAGPSGVDYRRDTTPVTPETTATPAQPTEPVAPAQPFTEEPHVDQQQTAPEEPTGTQPTEEDTTDARLRVLEALEKGEIDIEDALAQLDREPGNA
jgi:hypothetical protein